MADPVAPLFHVTDSSGRDYAMTPADLMDTLTYANYRFNRQRTPAITSEAWRKVIPAFTEAMETRYQVELATLVTDDQRRFCA